MSTLLRPTALTVRSAFVAVAFACLWLVGAGHAVAEVAIPELRTRVTDLTATLSRPQQEALEQKLAAFEARKGSQIAVLLVPTTQPETIEQYSIRVVENWRLGRAKVDDGVLVLVAKDDREVRIEVGYGLEGVVPDVLANRVINQVIVPRFRAGDFSGGIDAAVDRLIALIDGEALPEPPRRPQQEPGPGAGFVILMMLIFGFAAILRRIFGRLFGAGITGIVAGVIAFIATGILVVALLATVVAFFLALLGGGGFWHGGGSRRRPPGGWVTPGSMGGMGGFGRPGGFGGGGFGGFRGGGGGFGGGGASGRW